jgi:hypothetical protein
MKKNRLNQIILSVVFGFSVILSACTDKDEPTPENHATVSIESPREGEIVGSNYTLNISGMIRGEQELGGYTIYLRRKSDNDIIFQRSVTANNTALPFNEQWVSGKIVNPAELELEVVANLGANGATLSKKVNLQVMP